MLRKAKFLFIAVHKRFSSLPNEEETQKKIDFLIKAIDTQSLGTTFEENGQYYVNKMDQLRKFMISGRSVAIFRPRRMGKTTMINDLEFLYKNGKDF